jgi:hypothetical protein
VYGYFENIFRKRVTLLTANNWEREQNNNTFSEDAENIIVELDREEPKLSWYDLTKKRYRYPSSIFAVKREIQYDLSSIDFDGLLADVRKKIIESGNVVLMVEKTETSIITDSAGKKEGYSKPRYFREIRDVSFKKLDYNYIFNLPVSEEYHLTLRKRRYNKQQKEYKIVNLFAIIPLDDGIRSQVIRDVPVLDDKEIIFRISAEGIHPIAGDALEKPAGTDE